MPALRKLGLFFLFALLLTFISSSSIYAQRGGNSLTDGQIDINNDGVVNLFDYNIVVGQYGWFGHAAGNPIDLDDDGDGDGVDFNNLQDSYGLIAPQWKTSQSAKSVCLTDGTVGIDVSFSNIETGSNNSMDVEATDTQSGSILDLGTVPPQHEASGIIQTGMGSIDNGLVVFDLTWTNGDPRTDQRYANYAALTCQTASPTPFITQTPTSTPPVTIVPSPTISPQACAINYNTINFTNMSGTTNKEGNMVSNQYEGVVFSLENCSISNPRVAQVGAPLRAYTYGNNSPDGSAVGETFGPSFITDSGFFGADDSICTIVIDYLPNYRTSTVHLDLLDIDGYINNSGTSIYERFNVVAYDSNNVQVASQEILRSDNLYDGKAYRINLISQPFGNLIGGPKPLIAKVKISGTSNR